MRSKWVKSNWRRWLIIATCILFIADKQIWHKIQFDPVTIWLIIIIAFFLILPNPQVILPYVKRIKLWEAEIELKEEIKELEKEVEKVQDLKTDTSDSRASSTIASDVVEVLHASSKDPRAALLLLSAKIEGEVKKRLEEAKIQLSKRYTPASEAVSVGVKAGIFPPELLPAFRDFWSVRNRVAHAEGFDVPDSTIFSLISLGIELLKFVSTDKV